MIGKVTYNDVDLFVHYEIDDESEEDFSVSIGHVFIGGWSVKDMLSSHVLKSIQNTLATRH